MHQTEAIHTALKRLLRARGKTYADAAAVLGLSEASVKRLFSQAGLSLSRLEQLCSWLGMDVGDVVAMSEGTQPLVTRLNPEQERELLASPRLLLITFLVLNRWSETEILEQFDLTRPELTRNLGHLEQLGLIELFPFGRIKLRTARNFAWRPDGPIQRFFAEQVLPDFLDSRFDDKNEQMHFLGGTLTADSVSELQELMEKMAHAFDERVERDLKRPFEERQSVSLFVALRPWEFSGFARLRRKKDGNSTP